ncbi:LpxL/LpxP family Kdo(2)-lipid IV(A) lauroyl/palmitoleoyl acyltransferase [Vibrio sp. 10N.261.46.E12]|uniref:LpxL/LpxP family Kdo(2)-lipid IV(A) lauroyl/palmitoleoyl acyltransferase n=1 Tax=unclassified Vibrio TaxID=2614977 RepID=UPI00097823FC|nr:MULTISPECIES: LpxL/LpxP family Kdo(2)-lipid IV(A) lauroyl/palmitoleoyl acyltransferase [unclassified Vibrio]OMO38385.1 lipid A biosynthesis lauroyl acyltransferase [Vibrio sp. 10N.261.45.E1]PMJ26076.1 lipid A biosynthesis lauroyl acyltransferase [Vibrio sp. 10N.286.45.B6]PML89611.1 lipid A biosynthesis lauroyl acyltransferase [Vibrio sp. 10N.261.49.E11]PMM69721.1 lipid A biosynthesis lauroyl acyltransferase [Vibrio sp. 10N.261.46.F12]PMM90681.1 lipid A biosynthesis lauroyl acyltransferase [
MKKTTVEKPEFTLSLLHPKYWGVWFGFGLLALIVNILPYAILYRIGRTIGKLGIKVGKSRVKIAERNLELAFPDMNYEQRKAMVEENFKNTGMALIETGITWFWPTWRFKRILIAKDIQALQRLTNEGKGVLLCCVHALNLEITARAFAVLGLQGYGAYRPHSNPAYEFIQFRGRTQNGNRLIYRRDIKQMIRVLRKGERLFYLPDQDYGHNKSVFVPFFAVNEACTTTGTSILAYTSKCAIVPGSGFRNSEGKYEIIADRSIGDNYPKNDEIAAATYMNSFIEEIIMRAPEQWMWLHKRFKSLPNHSQTNSRYQ